MYKQYRFLACLLIMSPLYAGRLFKPYNKHDLVVRDTVGGIPKGGWRKKTEMQKFKIAALEFQVDQLIQGNRQLNEDLARSEENTELYFKQFNKMTVAWIASEEARNKSVKEQAIKQSFENDIVLTHGLLTFIGYKIGCFLKMPQA